MQAQIQAPAGGAVSPLNGEFYAGGQFMCNQFAMPKGYTKLLKKAVAKRTSNTSNIAALRVSIGRLMMRMSGETREECVFTGDVEQCKEFARQLIAAKKQQAEQCGFVAHPTELIL